MGLYGVQSKQSIFFVAIWAGLGMAGICGQCYATEETKPALMSNQDQSKRVTDASPSMALNPDALPEMPAGGSAAASPWESNLWMRVASGFSIPDLEGSLVERHERSYADDPDRLRKLIERAKPYLYYIVNEVERRGMPMEIALLPMIESAFNPYANSPAHASGLWQIMPATGRHLGLSQNHERDERLDVMAATHSALDYLEYLHTLFPDWQLALAAYNWGEGSLGRSVSRNQNKGLLVDYWTISMPRETRNYVPKLQALKNIIRNPSAYGVEIPIIPDRPYFRSVMIDKPMVVEHVAQLADISVREFSSLNPAFKKTVINGSGNPYRLLVPVEKAPALEQGIKGGGNRLLGGSVGAVFNPSAWAVNQVANGEPAAELSSKTVLSEATPSVNGVKGEVRQGAGETLVLPAVVVKPELQMTDEEEEEVAAPVVRWQEYRILRRDTLQGIGERYGVSVEDIVRWNHLKTRRAHPGHILRLRVERSAVPVRKLKHGDDTKTIKRESKTARHHARLSKRGHPSASVVRRVKNKKR
jgi:membrane-bound lytic murein transglycosylase D